MLCRRDTGATCVLSGSRVIENARCEGQKNDELLHIRYGLPLGPFSKHPRKVGGISCHDMMSWPTYNVLDVDGIEMWDNELKRKSEVLRGFRFYTKHEQKLAFDDLRLELVN